jgi:hypothetical protein
MFVDPISEWTEFAAALDRWGGWAEGWTIEHSCS